MPRPHFFQMQVSLLGLSIQSYVDVYEMIGPFPLLFHSESFKTKSSVNVLIKHDPKVQKQ